MRIPIGKDLVRLIKDKSRERKIDKVSKKENINSDLIYSDITCRHMTADAEG